MLHNTVLRCVPHERPSMPHVVMESCMGSPAHGCLALFVGEKAVGEDGKDTCGQRERRMVPKWVQVAGGSGVGGGGRKQLRPKAQMVALRRILPGWLTLANSCECGGGSQLWDSVWGCRSLCRHLTFCLTCHWHVRLSSRCHILSEGRIFFSRSKNILNIVSPGYLGAS